jgi:hypothetical protein
MSNQAPKTNRIGAEGLQELIDRREAKKGKKPGLAKMSPEMMAEKREIKIKFHTPVQKRDGAICQYCFELFDKRERPSEYGDHVLTQGMWGEHKLDVWNGIAVCRWCNEARGVYKTLWACIGFTQGGILQMIGRDVSVRGEPERWLWKARILAGVHVGEWKEIPEDVRLGNGIKVDLS